MFFYTCSAGNPEGTDFTLHMCSYQEYSKEAFHDLCEALIVETLEEEYKEKKYAFINSINTDILFSKFKSRGFDYVRNTAGYYLEPYWGKDSIKSEALKKWCDGRDDELKKLAEEEERQGAIKKENDRLDAELIKRDQDIVEG